MAQNYKNPPVFLDEKDYDTWKNEIEIWRLMTDLSKKKQALAVTLTLSGKARETAIQVPAASLNADDGMDVLISELDKCFLQEVKDSAYQAYKNFDTFVRSDTQSCNDYIIEFEHKYNRAKKFKMELPDAILAFKLLESANLSEKEKQLALTACHDLTFMNMKSALKRIFGSIQCSNDSASSIQVKQESAFYTENQRKSGQRYRQYGKRFEKPSSQPNFKGTNPLNKFGKRSQCAICKSTFHWAKDCPHNTDRDSVNITADSDDVEEVNITLFTKEQNKLSDAEIFMIESQCSAVIDTACTRTVCGEKWFNDFSDTIDERKITISPSEKLFRFGDGKTVKSFSKAKIPVCIGKKKCHIETEILKSNIPLLLSKSSLKKAGTILDLSKDKAVMFDEPVELHFTSSGHYCIDILDKSNQPVITEDEILVVDDDMDESKKRNMLQKLHRQFGHASYDRLKKLLQSAGNDDRKTFELLQETIEKCDTCLKYKKTSPRPVVGLPLATRYNETVAVDLHELDRNLWYLHIIDEFSRYSAGCIVRSKSASVFVDSFIKYWISVHGAPARIFSDNGGEFNNAEARDMAENFNIEVLTTAAYSPWSNGLLERHNHTLTNMLLKIKHEKDCSWDTAMCWALMAKNALQNVHGFSPNQLVFGQNPNLPSVLVDKPPALEGSTMSTVVGNHITALHAARKSFTESECSERIRRALRKQTRPSGNCYFTGDKVYYKRPDSVEWKGPGVVIGQQGSVVFVRHGGLCVRVHPSRLSKIGQSSVDTESKKDDAPKPVLSNTENSSVIDSALSDDESNPIDLEEQRSDLQPDLNMIKRGQNVSYIDQNTREKCVVSVLGRAGKATGKNKYWYNVRYLQPDTHVGSELSIDLSKVENIEILNTDLRENHNTQNEDNEEIMIINNISMHDAKLAELESWRENNVFKEVPDNGQKCISTRWVCSVKTTTQGELKHKARLVARGFEEIPNNEISTDSPTCASESLRLVLAIFAQNNWIPHSMDIKTAFLQGQNIERDIFIRPPKEAKCSGIVWHLQKCVYGLNDASLHWYRKVKCVMAETGGKVSKLDPSVFYWSDKTGNLTGVLTCHVDDFIWGGASDFEKTVINHIREALKVGKENSVAFQYCGMNLVFDNDLICLDQNRYAENLSFINIDRDQAVHKDRLLSEDEKSTLRAKIGQILWLAHQSRPDIIFDACNLAASVRTATVKDILYANKIIRRIKSDNITLKFRNLGCGEKSLVVFTDASLGNLPNGGSQGGYIVLLMSDNGTFSPICWNSKKIRRVARSTIAAETLAMADGIDMTMFLSSLYSELMTGTLDSKLLTISCITDCKSLFEAVRSTKQVIEKRLRMELSSIKELIESGHINKVLWVDSEKQLANCLTKQGASSLTLIQSFEKGVLSVKI